MLDDFRQKDFRVETFLSLRDDVPVKGMLSSVVHQMRRINGWLFEDEKVLCCFIFHILILKLLAKLMMQFEQKSENRKPLIGLSNSHH